MRSIAFASALEKCRGDGRCCPPSDRIDDDLDLPGHLRSDRSPSLSVLFPDLILGAQREGHSIYAAALAQSSKLRTTALAYDLGRRATLGWGDRRVGIPDNFNEGLTRPRDRNCTMASSWTL